MGLRAIVVASPLIVASPLNVANSFSLPERLPKDLKGQHSFSAPFSFLFFPLENRLKMRIFKKTANTGELESDHACPGKASEKT